MHLVKQHNGADIGDIISGKDSDQSDKLAKGDDITASIIDVPKQVVDQRQPSNVALQKAAIITFKPGGWALLTTFVA